PDSDFQFVSRQQRSWSSKRNKIGKWGFQPNNRYTHRRPVRTIWHGIRTKALTNVLNSKPSTHRFSAWCFSCQHPGSSGSNNAHPAFRSQGNAVITMKAQLLARLFTGARKARTPPPNWANRFSWSQRSLAVNTIASASLTQSLVM